MKFKHILVSQRYEAEDLLKLIQEGKAFESLVARYSNCSSASAGGDLGEILKSKNVNTDFREACECLKIGIISKPIRTQFGYHIILRYE